MSSNPKPKFERMTVERLREHLFGGPQVPFWNYDPAQLTIGIEVEYFIAHVHTDGSFTLATKDEYMKVVGYLIRNFSYLDTLSSGQVGRVSKDTSLGFVAIKPDFAWHILEIAFPPRSNLEELEVVVDSILFQVDEALNVYGLQRLDLSCLPRVPAYIELVELARLSGHIDLLRNQSDESIYSNPLYPALIAATHVHLNVLNEDTFLLLPKLYSFESEARAKFSRVQNFSGIQSNRHRELFYKHNLGSRYLLSDIPEEIPNNLATYADLYDRSIRLFPNDPYFPVRDLTAIRPTRFGTIEFRSSCSFLEGKKLLAIAAFRKQKFLDSLALLPSHLRVAK
jgi:hypothetical protein